MRRVNGIVGHAANWTAADVVDAQTQRDRTGVWQQQSGSR